MGFLGRAMESILGNLILGDQLPVACSLGGGGVGGAGIILGDPRPGTKTQKIPTSLERSARSDSGGSDSGARSLGGGEASVALGSFWGIWFWGIQRHKGEGTKATST